MKVPHRREAQIDRGQTPTSLTLRVMKVPQQREAQIDRGQTPAYALLASIQQTKQPGSDPAAF